MLKKFYVVLAVGAFIIKNNKLLIVKKSPYENIDAGLWTIPGGKIEKDEPIIDGLKREVKEEVNLEISDYQWLGEDVLKVMAFGIMLNIFYVRLKIMMLNWKKN
jgi:ADP-ribose pyrophosphatase